MNNLTNLLALADSAAIGASDTMTPRTSITATELGEDIRPVVHITGLHPGAYRRSVGQHSDRLHLGRVLGDAWAYIRIVGDPADDPADLLHELINALEEHQR